MVENVTMIYSKREKCEKCGADILIRYKQGMRVIDYPLCKKCRNKHKDLTPKAERMEKIAAWKTRRL